MQKEITYIIEYCPIMKDGKYNIPCEEWDRFEDFETNDQEEVKCKRIDLCRSDQNNYYRVSIKK